MPPVTPEELFQDTNDVHSSVVGRRQRFPFALLFVVVLGLVLIQIKLRFFTSAPALLPTQTVASQPTPAPRTGTFVDELTGELVFLRDNHLYSLTFPDRITSQIVGVSGTSGVVQFATVAPVWSADGKYVAFSQDASHLTVSEFDTGTFVGSFPVPLAKKSETLIVSFDPSRQLIAIGLWNPQDRFADSVTFYALSTQKAVGTYPRCQANGIWMGGIGFLTKCALADAQTIGLIQFTSESSTLIPVTRERAGLSYALLADYGNAKALVKRTIGATSDLVTLDMRGQIQVVPPSAYTAIGGVGVVSDPISALEARITKETGVANVKDVSVASSNDWLVFETDEGLYVAKMDLKDKPYFLGKGTMARIRPY